MRSSACCEPAVMTTSSGDAERPTVDARCAQTHSRRGRWPSVTPYWRAAGPSDESTASQERATASTGKSSGAGSPPAKEMTSGAAVTLRISRMALGLSAVVRAAKR